MGATDNKSVPSKKDNIVVRKSGDDYILVPVVNNIADMTAVYTLNETGAFIWDLIDGERDTGRMARLLADNYETDIESAHEDVIAFLSDIDHLLHTAP